MLLLLLLLRCFSHVKLCDPIDGSPPGSAVPGILQARTLERAAFSFSNAWKWKVKVKSLSRVRLLATPWTAAHQAPPSMGFSRQKYWSGVPLPSPLVSLGNSNCMRTLRKDYSAWQTAQSLLCSVGLTWWTLAWGVLHTHGTISLDHEWEFRPNLSLYRDHGEMETEEWRVLSGFTQGPRMVWRLMVTLCACPAAEGWSAPPAPKDRAAVPLPRHQVGRGQHVTVFTALPQMMEIRLIKNKHCRAFLVVETLPFHCRGCGFSPWLGNKDPTCSKASITVKYFSTLSVWL